MGELKKRNPNTNFGYQPKNKPQRDQHHRVINEGYQPVKPILTQPPDRGSNVKPVKTEK